MPDDVESPKVVEPVVEKPEDKPEDKAHPETVSWTQYVGLKETSRKAEAELKTKVETLEGQLKVAVTPEEHTKIKEELEGTKVKLQEAADKLKETLDKSLSEKRGVLINKGMSKEEAEKMSEEAVDGAIKALATYKPAPDMSGGGGDAGKLEGSPMVLAQRAYASSNK